MDTARKHRARTEPRTVNDRVVCFNLELRQERFFKNLPFNSIHFATLEIEVNRGNADLLSEPSYPIKSQTTLLGRM